MLLIIANFKKFCRFILVSFKIPIRFRKLKHGVKIRRASVKFRCAKKLSPMRQSAFMRA